MNFADRLISEIKKKQSAVVAGLDPTYEGIPAFVRQGLSAGEAVFVYNKRLMNAVAPYVCAFKPQLAYYEALGVEGIAAFDATVKYAKTLGVPVIADGKRNDIGSTSAAYAEAFLSEAAFGADALTVNPYLGEDGLIPFIDNCEKHGRGIFMLVKTSNPSSGQLQDLEVTNGKKIYEHVAALADSLGERVIGECGYSSVGAVVGATYPEQASVLRKIMKKNIILVPGYGAQGGSADSVAVNFNEDGLGAVVNASRSIMNAYKSPKWADKYNVESFDLAAEAEAIDMRDAINSAVAKIKV